MPAVQLINTGTFPNDTTGDPLQTAFNKINGNFNSLSGATGAVIGPPVFPPGAVALTVNAAQNNNALVINGASGSSGGDVTINTVTGVGLGVVSATAPFSQIFVKSTINNAGSFAEVALAGDNTTNNFFMTMFGSAHTGGPLATLGVFGAVPMNINVNGNGGINLSTSGTITMLAPPVTGPTLTINGVSGSDVVSVVAASSSSSDRLLQLVWPGHYNILQVHSDGSFSFGNASGNTFTGSAAGNIAIAAPSSGVPFTVSGVANQFAIQLNASSTSGQSFGQSIIAGTTAADIALNVQNQAATAQFLRIFGDGHGTLGPSATLGQSWSASGNVTINTPSAGTALTVTAFANSFAQIINTPTSAGTSFGILVSAGTNATDAAVNINNAANTLTYFKIYGDGGVTIGPATGGSKGAGTLNVSSGIYLNNVLYTSP